MTTCRNIKHDEQRRRSALQRAAAAEASASAAEAAERLERDGVLAFLGDKRHAEWWNLPFFCYLGSLIGFGHLG